MTTSADGSAPKAERLTENLARIEALTQRLIAVMARREPPKAALQGPDPALFLKAGAACWAEMMQNPARILELQVNYWGKTLKHYADAQDALGSGTLAAPDDPTPDDSRFANPLWKTHPYFNFVKQQYLLAVDAAQQAVQALDAVDAPEKRRIEYFTQAIMDMMAPTNFLATNPDALARAVETEGESLVRGLENLVRDLEVNKGELLVTLSDRDAFRVGGNIATTPGKVVFRNRMFELIQYAPATEQVHRTPLVIFPPWINKFYILDLKPANSLVRWIVDQGYTLFVVSWVNPDPSYADVGLDEYVSEGILEALRVARAITGEPQVNAVGYCIAGTALALTLALLEKRRDRSVRSASFLTTLTDFSDRGEVGVFLEEDFLNGIEAEVGDRGLLRSVFMTRTFSFLRARDLIYGPAIRSYLLGEAPPAFDLLYWNGDGTNLPARMTVQYLRGLCQQDRFAAGGFRLCGEDLTLGAVKVPLCAIACETDHIAAWRSSFLGVAQMGSRSKEFILSQSGHIAGIVNPPSRNKYGHYTADGPIDDPDSWRARAQFHDGSWWPRWEAWLRKRSGAMVAARIPGDSGYPALEDAPGTYVTAIPDDGKSDT